VASIFEGETLKNILGMLQMVSKHGQ